MCVCLSLPLTTVVLVAVFVVVVVVVSGVVVVVSGVVVVVIQIVVVAFSGVAVVVVTGCCGCLLSGVVGDVVFCLEWLEGVYNFWSVKPVFSCAGMELCNGGSLFDYMKGFSRNEHIIANYTLQMCRGLAYLHENHVIHRDILPPAMSFPTLSPLDRPPLFAERLACLCR